MTSGEEVTDPVCKMKISPSDAVDTVDYEGTTYYFCSQDCAGEENGWQDVDEEDEHDHLFLQADMFLLQDVVVQFRNDTGNTPCDTSAFSTRLLSSAIEGSSAWR